MRSLELSRPTRSCTRSSARPHQLARMAMCSAGWPRIAGVHSTVWILAIRAALISRAFSNSWSSFHDGYDAASRSQIALCSRMNSVCMSSRPTHQPSRPPEVPSSAGSTSIRPSAPIRTRPPVPVRMACSNSRHAPVDLGRVPPVRLGVDEGRRPVGRVVGGVLGRARPLHRVVGPVVARRARDADRVLHVGAVAEPVARLELQPGGREDVQRRRGLELVAQQQDCR